jgi:hypothetical protein
MSPAPKGNLFAVGNTGGRPPLYESAEEISNKIAEYIDWEDKASGNGKAGKGKYTMEGCALFLGFCSVQSLYDNEKRNDEFSYVIKRFRLWLQAYHVQGLRWAGSTQGSIFWLKNKSDYKDEVTQHQIQTITQVQPKVVNTGVPLAGSEKEIKE